MIPYCVRVLRGRVPEQNDRNITKGIAIILLAHLVADIHQPLHVGAEYFDARARVADPDKNRTALADEGGNTFILQLADESPNSSQTEKPTFHGFWDYDAVVAALGDVRTTAGASQRELPLESRKRDLVHDMLTHEPHNWRIPSNVGIENYAEAWADEILTVAREAHARLQFADVHSEDDKGRTVAAGMAKEIPQSDHLSYRQWAAKVVRGELHKAAWRLADLLTKTL